MKKLPLIGLIVGSIAAGWQYFKRKKQQKMPEDTQPPA